MVNSASAWPFFYLCWCLLLNIDPWLLDIRSPLSRNVFLLLWSQFVTQSTFYATFNRCCRLILVLLHRWEITCGFVLLCVTQVARCQLTADVSSPWACDAAGHDGQGGVLCKSCAASTCIIHRSHHEEALFYLSISCHFTFSSLLFLPILYFLISSASISHYSKLYKE